MTVLANGAGGITCTQDKLLWCEHIETMVKQGHDSEYIFHEAALASKNHQEYRIDVPIFPSDDVWALVQLRPVFRDDNTPQGSLEVTFLPEEQGVGMHSDGIDLRNVHSMKVGLLNPGEGRNVLRQMILDWFYPELGEERACVSIHHTFRVRVELAEKIKDNARAQFLNAWLLVMIRKCLVCFSKAPNVVEEWDEDLLPDDEPPRKFNPYRR